MTKKNSIDAAGFLNAQDLMSGGGVRSTTVPGFEKPIFYKPMKASVVLEFMEQNEQMTDLERTRRMIDQLVETLTTPDGQQLVTKEQLLDVPMETLTSLVLAVSNARVADVGNASGEAMPDALPIA